MNMCRTLLIVLLCAQLLAANTAFAGSRCAHADMGADAATNAEHSHHAGAMDSAAHADHSGAGDDSHCRCLCDIVGHCPAGSAGMAQTASLPPPLFERSAAMLTAATARAALGFKTPLYRPPSST